MCKKIFLFLLCVAIASCGTHRKMTSSKRKEDKTGVYDKKKEIKEDIEYKGIPWVYNGSRPISITKGLQNRHLSIYASHGRYFNKNKNRWEWQRPNLFCTNEDLYTQTIVVPYLIPMLEKAGAIVFTPRERDWQKNEIIIDNDNKTLLPYYTEINIKQEWKDAGIKGFANTEKYYDDGENPFEMGTTRSAKSSAVKGCEISYQPNFPEKGQYAVYVSYPAHKKNVSDAQYIVYHQGRKTVFHVNQQMGGGTWVYLGTFDFDSGCNSGNRVVLTNESSYSGFVTADAVRFGGGMGNIKRKNTISGLPRCLEGARYYAQWAGAPDSVYRSKNGTDDYKEDIYSRPFMANWLAGGSCFAPTLNGLNVPIEMSLAVHSDAGVAKDYASIIGTLSICTTFPNDGVFGSGLSRLKSKIFANKLLEGVNKDIKAQYGKWTKREVYDKNYAETRCPQMTSAILETLSHQNFPDMIYGQDPNFRFTLARSIYKSILRMSSEMHKKPYVVTPLTPVNVRAEFCANDTLLIKWDAQTDKSEPSAVPDSYILYTSVDGSGFDNGIKVNGPACKVKLMPDMLYNFKVSAANAGGESFQSEVISAVYHSNTAKNILIINGFQRLAAPAVINNDSIQGFDLNKDMGVADGKTLGFCGSQICFDKTKLGIEGPGGLGYSGSELEGVIIKGNEFNYIPEHAKAIMASDKYNIVSCSKSAVENDKVVLNKYNCIDAILGLEKDDGYSLNYYKTFSSSFQKQLADYKGNLIVSGAYIGSDMKSGKEQKFLNDVLHVTYNGTVDMRANNKIEGMNTSFDIYSYNNDVHYASSYADILSPVSPAFCALTDVTGNSLCVAYDENGCRTFTMGFPFECIKSEKKRAVIMTGILNFIFK